MDIKELYDKKAKAYEEAKKFLDEHQAADGTLSEEDSATFEKMSAEITKIGAEIKQQEQQEKIADVRGYFRAAATKPILNAPQSAFGGDKSGRASAAYQKAFMTFLRSQHAPVSNVLQVAEDIEGGYLVPEEMDERLIVALEEENIMRGLGTVIQTAGDHKINLVSAKPTAGWLDENEEITPSSEKFDQVKLLAHKVGSMLLVTEELLADSMFDLESHITAQIGEALGRKEEACLIGDGTGRPTGLFVTALKTDSPETAGANLASDDLINLIYKLKRPYRKNAVFVMNDKIVAEVRKLKDDNKQYLWQPSMQQGEPDRLLGFPVYTSSYAPGLLTEAGERNSGGAIIAFGDMNYYNIADRGTRWAKVLRELYATKGQVGFIVKERMDGKLILPEAVEVLKLKA